MILDPIAPSVHILQNERRRNEALLIIDYISVYLDYFKAGVSIIPTALPKLAGSMQQ